MWMFRLLCRFFFFKQKTAYEMRSSDWSSDVCSSDLDARRALSAMLTVSRGLDILDAEANPLLTELAFTKLNGRFGANHVIGREEIGRASCRARVCQYG